jgi:hypothetical protein
MQQYNSADGMGEIGTTRSDYDDDGDMDLSPRIVFKIKSISPFSDRELSSWSGV